MELVPLKRHCVDEHQGCFPGSALGSTPGIRGYVELLRPQQMIKNLFCLAGVIFSGEFRNPDHILAAFEVFVSFCALSSAVYIFNDILDLRRDQSHSRKCNRPLPSGRVSIRGAIVLAVVMATLGFALGWTVGLPVTACLTLYLVNNVIYSAGLKHYAIIDVLCIAFGFLLRLLAGIYAVNVMPTSWIVLCTFFLTMFLGFSKRRAELAEMLPDATTFQRPVLSKYTVQFLDYLINNTAVMTIVCYALFTTTSNKNPSLVITVPIVFFAIMHYKRMVMLFRVGEEPEYLLARDLRLHISLLIWLVTYIVVVFGELHLFA